MSQEHYVSHLILIFLTCLASESCSTARRKFPTPYAAATLCVAYLFHKPQSGAVMKIWIASKIGRIHAGFTLEECEAEVSSRVSGTRRLHWSCGQSSICIVAEEKGLLLFLRFLLGPYPAR